MVIGLAAAGYRQRTQATNTDGEHRRRATAFIGRLPVPHPPVAGVTIPL
jgi:hypothetical protein